LPEISSGSLSGSSSGIGSRGIALSGAALSGTASSSNRSSAAPRIAVFASLFPSAVRPGAGLFIRERMFRVAPHIPLVVVSPQPWFPGLSLLQKLRPGYRPQAPALETQSGVTVHHPRFFALPGVGRRFDGFFMAWACQPLMQRLVDEGVCLIDAHFAYPDGYAATLLGRALGVPVTITLRGTEVPQRRIAALKKRMTQALQRAARVFSVSDSLRRVALELGCDPDKTEVVGNGVDAERFAPADRAAARDRLSLPAAARVLISVGGLVERKGMHRVIACLPALLQTYPDLHYLVVGSGGPEGDMRAELDAQIAKLGLGERVHFLGALPPYELRWPLSAADVFVLATRNEGWANVFLEAMACGLPVVATDVGGNAEVVCREDLGSIVPFGNQAALTAALDAALARDWDRAAIRGYACANHWDRRVEQLVAAFAPLLAGGRA
jgi:glycosyltransferase involved in cell wall biosynthesis